MQQGMEEGINFLQKPYSPNKLAEIVRQCLDKKAGIAPADASVAGKTPAHLSAG
jgi:DNA-binding NtrC family response regulator